MLVITTWLWGSKYNASDVEKLSASVSRNLNQPHMFVCVSDRLMSFSGGIIRRSIKDRNLLLVDGCFARLRMFDPEWQSGFWVKQEPDDRIVNIDLDTVITGNLDLLFDRKEPFLIMQGANSVNPCRFCGAMMMVRRGAVPHLWSWFSLDDAMKIPFHKFPDDQGWIWAKEPNAAGWQCGRDGVYAFHKPGWPKGSDDLPSDARLVTFNGFRSPQMFNSLPWIREHWRT